MCRLTHIVMASGAVGVAPARADEFTLKYADYNAKAFATEPKKFWASLELAL